MPAMLTSFTNLFFSNKRLPYGHMAVRDRFADIQDRLKTESPIIVDGGANLGTTVDLFLSQYAYPKIYAFEPLPDVVKVLKDKYSSIENVVIYEQALGAENKLVSFNMVNRLDSSSILQPSDIGRGYNGQEMYSVKQTLEVQQVRLDEVLDVEEVDIIKLDLQGYELEALKGCDKLLERVKIITTEVEFVPLYENQPLFGDISIFFREKGFTLLNLYELYTHPNGQLIAGDAVYLNKRYF